MGLEVVVNLREEMYAGLDQIQDKEFDVFTALLTIFNKYKLRYFVTGGTVLGANFYQNFIPYDDDIDVALVREDYNKFIEMLYHELPKEYRVKHYTLDSNFKYTIIRVENTSIDITEVSDPKQKISHPSIDIAPLDGTPSGNISKRFFFARLLVLRGILTGCYADSINMNKDRSIKDKVLIHSLKIGGRIFKSVVNPTNVKRRIDKILSQHSFDNSPLIGTYMGAYRSKEMLPKWVWGNGKQYKFRNLTITGPENTEAYIKLLYGGFRELTDDEAFKARHYVIKERAKTK